MISSIIFFFLKRPHIFARSSQHLSLQSTTTDSMSDLSMQEKRASRLPGGINSSEILDPNDPHNIPKLSFFGQLISIAKLIVDRRMLLLMP